MTELEELQQDHDEARQSLSDWHDTRHGHTLWAGCQQEPCNVLNHFFRSTP